MEASLRKEKNVASWKKVKYKLVNLEYIYEYLSIDF